MWKKNGRPIDSNERVTQGNYGKSLLIKVVDFEDEGTYTCTISNGVGEPKSSSIKLSILGKFISLCNFNKFYGKIEFHLNDKYNDVQKSLHFYFRHLYLFVNNYLQLVIIYLDC